MKAVNRIFFAFSLFFLAAPIHGMALLRPYTQRMTQRSATIMRSPIARSRINTSWRSTISGWFTHVRNYCGWSAPMQTSQIEQHSTIINEKLATLAAVEKEKPAASKEEQEILDFIKELFDDAAEISILSYSIGNNKYENFRKVLNNGSIINIKAEKSKVFTAFFKNSSIDTIRPLFERLIRTNSGCNFLTYYINRSVCAKLAPLVEEYFETITKHANGLDLVLHVLSYAKIQSNPHFVSKLFFLVKSQPSCLIQASQVTYHKKASFFYESLKELMDILFQYKDVHNTNNELRLYERTIQALEEYSYFIKGKLVQEDNQENMKQECSSIIQKPWSPCVIKSIDNGDIKENPNIVPALVAAFKEHFHYIKNNNDHDLFDLIKLYLKLTAMHSTETKEDLVIFLSKQSDLFKITQSSLSIDAVIKKDILSTLLQELLSSEKNQELAKQSCLNLLLSPCDESLDILLRTYAGIGIGTDRTMLNSIIIPLIKEHFNHIISQDNGYRFINRITYNIPYPKCEDLYEFLVAQKDTLIKHPEGLEILVIVLGSTEFENNFPELAFGVDSTHETASYKHLKEHARIICTAGTQYNAPLNRMITQNSLKNMVQKILYKEKELEDSGYEVFYHGRRWEYGLITDMYSVLYEYKSGKPLNDFMFTHLDDPALGKKINPSFFKTEQAKRERLLKEGNLNTKTEGIASRQSLLFLNKFLFGNTNNIAKNSLNYILENFNVGNIAISIKEVFTMFGYSSAYKTYEQELEELSKEYNQLSSFGQLLLVAIPKNKVADCIYYTTGGGQKLSFSMTTCGADGKQTTVYETDINKILHYLHNNPVDFCEFVMIMTKDKNGGSNPESGIKVFPFNAVEPEKWAAFEEKRKALFARIVQTLAMMQEARN